MKLIGVTLIRNGNRLEYPWKLCIKRLSSVCNQVWVNCDKYSTDNTWKDLVVIADKNRKVEIVPSIWNMSNTGNGKELAHQINLILNQLCRCDWVLYLQADEFIHENDAEKIRTYLSQLSSDVTQVELYRTYFWKDLNHRSVEDEIWLGRIFRPNTHLVGGDGMYLVRQYGNVARLDVNIYHYSRLGDEKIVNKRIRTLDSLFHEADIIKDFEDFSYKTDKKIVEYTGPHPQGIKEFYNKRR